MKTRPIRTYSDLILLPTFEERFEYLKLSGIVGEETFGWDRYLNQVFYRSQQWKSIRNKVIVRDNGCDLGVEGYEIYDRVLVHHMNPLMLKDIVDVTPYLLNPDYLISTSFNTHQAIHYGDESLLITEPIIREPNDTKLW